MNHGKKISFLSAAVLAAALGSSAQAASGTWTNLNGGNWSTGANWSSGIVADGAGSTADFSTINITATRTVTIDGLAGSRTVGTMLLGDSASTFSGYIIAANNSGTLTFNNSGSTAVLTQAVNSGANIVSAPIILADNLNITNSNAALFTISGGITGAKNLALNANAAGGITLSTASVNNGGTITNSGSGAGAVTVAIVGSNVTGVTQNSNTSALTVTTLNANSGGTTLTSGGTSLLTVTNSVAGTGALVLNANSTGGITLTGGANTTGAITNSGTAAGVVTVTGAIGTNVTGVTQDSATSVLALNGSNTFNTGLKINKGTVKLGGTTSAGAGLVTIGSSGNSAILDLNGASRTINSLATDGTGGDQTIGNSGIAAATLNYTGATTSIFDGVIQDAVSGGTSTTALTVNNASANLTLYGANTYSGLTTVSAGTLVLGGGNSSSGGTTLAGGILQLASSANGGLASGNLSLNGGAVQAVGGTRTISNAVLIGGTAAITSGSQNLVFSGKVTGLTGANRVLTNNISINPLSLTDVDISNDTGATARTLTINGSGDTEISGVIANGTGTSTDNNLTISSTGTTSLNGANTYTGTTTISGTNGTTILSGSNSGGGANALNAGTVQLNSVTNGGLSTGVITLAGAKLEALNASRTLSNDVTLNTGTIQGSQNLVINGKVTGLTAGSRTITNNIGSGKSLTLANIDINPETANVRGLTIAGSGDTNVTGVIANGNVTTANTVTVSSTGTTTFSGASTYTGATTISSGAKLNVTGSLGATAVTVSGGGVLSGAGNGTTTGLIGTTTAGSVTLAAGTTAGTRGTIDMNDGAIGTLTLQGASGGTILTMGSIAAGSSSVLNFETGASSTDKIAIGNSGKMTLNLGGAIINLTSLPSTSLALGNYNLLTYASGSTFTGSFVLGSPSTVGGNRYLLSNTGTATQLTVTNNVASASANAYWTGAQGATWESGVTSGGASNFVTTNGGSTDAGIPVGTTNVFFSSTGATNLTNSIQNNYTINSLNFLGTAAATSISGTGLTLTLNGAGVNGNTAGSGLTVATGSAAHTISTNFALGANQTWTNSSTNTLTVAGSTTIGAGQVLTYGGGKFSLSVNNGLTGAGDIVINAGEVAIGNGSGNLFNGNFTGSITVNSGATLSFNGGGGSSFANMLGTGTLILNNGATVLAQGNAGGSGVNLTGEIWNGDFSIAGGKSTTLGGSVSLGTSAGTARTITTVAAATIFITPGIISNGTTATSLIKMGAGVHRLSGANNYTGSTTVNEGTLQISVGDNRLPTGTTLAVNGGAAVANAGTFDLNGLNQSVAGLTGGSGTVQGVVTNNIAGAVTSTLTVTGASTFDGIIKDGTASAVALTKSGTGTLGLTGANTYTGATTVSAGTLLITGTINNTSGVAVTGGTFNYNNNTTALTQAVSLAGGNFKYNSSQAYSGALTFTSGTVSGTGNLSGTALSFGTNQVMAPGNSTGTQAVGALTWANGGTFQFELNDATGVAGSTSLGWDLATTPSLNITAGSGQFTLQVVSLTAGQVAGLATNFNSGTSYNWLFLDAASAITSFNANQFAFDTTGFQNSFGGVFGVARGDTIIGGDSSQIFLTYTAVPEPSTYALVGMGLGALWFLRRRRDKMSKQA